LTSLPAALLHCCLLAPIPSFPSAHSVCVTHDLLQAQGPDLNDEEMRQQNPLAVLLRSLLPWVNLGQAPEGDADGAGGGDGPQQQQPEGGG
jgi:hypothetical protein